jgi:phenylalanyl-tRNA synthetase alpha chain
MIRERISKLKEDISEFKVSSKDNLETFRLKFLSKKSELQDLFALLKETSPEERKQIGLLINNAKQLAEQKFEEFQQEFGKEKVKKASVPDPTLPGKPLALGGRHPLSIVQNRINDIFRSMGFVLSKGPEIEDDWHNFSALNFPPNHPARDMQDTFFVGEELALRTHTSSVQVRIMEQQKPPIRCIMPGRVYRNEAISARANCFFHQVEGLYIDENVSFADLKQTLYTFVQQMFGADVKVRFRPSYFPFTEPSAEMDVSCFICNSKGCNVCKHSGWVEILGCGMVDPQVLINCNIDPEKYTGFAFGMGVERITMLKYDVNDLRIFFDNDIRFLQQFRGETP